MDAVRDPSPIPVIFIGGYLGAGKTTLVNRLLGGALGRRTAVLVNDFGEVNVDALLVRSADADTIELTNGCVCCSIGDSLGDALIDLLEREERPDRIVVELSGVADPRASAAFAWIGGFRPAGVVVLFDAVHGLERVADPRLTSTLRRQVMGADVIVLSKVDHPSAEIARSRAWLAETAPSVPVVEGCAAGVIEVFATDPARAGSTADDAVADTAGEHTEHRSVRVEPAAPPTRVDLDLWLGRLPAEVVRVKGVIALADGTTVLVQAVGRSVEIRPVDDVGTVGLVVIALGSDPPRLPPLGCGVIKQKR